MEKGKKVYETIVRIKFNNNNKTSNHDTVPRRLMYSEESTIEEDGCGGWRSPRKRRR